MTSRVHLFVAAALLLTVASLPATRAQIAPATRQNIAPVYEGWEQNPDGSFNLVFGYFNRNWEEVDVPVGPENTFEPGNPDQGQPTHFYPRRNRFVFRVPAPKDFGSRELVWNLTVHGKTERAFATLKPEYLIDDTTIMNNFGAGGIAGGSRDIIGNTAPTVKVEGDTTRRARVGESLTLAAVATDDGKPPYRPMKAPLTGTPNTANGLRLSWFVYRGRGTVTFDPPQISVWEDNRAGANSPWAGNWAAPPVPPGGKWVNRVTFKEPGTYVLRCLAHDGGLYDFEDVTVVVSR